MSSLVRAAPSSSTMQVDQVAGGKKEEKNIEEDLYMKMKELESELEII